MEDFRSLVWLGIAVIWILARIARRGVKKARGEKTPGRRPVLTRPAGRSASRPGDAASGAPASQPEILGRGGNGPPPIVPR